MSRITLGTVVALGLGFAVWATAGRAHEITNGSSNNDLTAACMEMMPATSGSEAGRKAMPDVMPSDQAPQRMAHMMAIARRMGNGDVMLGMARMMGMVEGGVMGSEGMIAPPPAQDK